MPREQRARVSGVKRVAPCMGMQRLERIENGGGGLDSPSLDRRRRGSKVDGGHDSLISIARHQGHQVCSPECKECPVFVHKNPRQCRHGVLCAVNLKGKDIVPLAQKKKGKYYKHVQQFPGLTNHSQFCFQPPRPPATVPSASWSSLTKPPAVHGRVLNKICSCH